MDVSVCVCLCVFLCIFCLCIFLCSVFSANLFVLVFHVFMCISIDWSEVVLVGVPSSVLQCAPTQCSSLAQCCSQCCSVAQCAPHLANASSGQPPHTRSQNRDNDTDQRWCKNTKMISIGISEVVVYHDPAGAATHKINEYMHLNKMRCWCWCWCWYRCIRQTLTYYFSIVMEWFLSMF